MQMTRDTQERIYAGVLGKMIGVYLGRPVEGWSYEAIQSRFGEIEEYIHEELNLPLVVTDDDLSGTFGFFRSVEDNHFPREITAKAVGESWLNYIVEDKTILWWGGLGNSTEHTAYLNLKRGIPAPKSGSAKQNGKVLSEQIGAQIFMDSFAMMCPGDPARAARLVRESASVSHDGLALEAAAFLGALEAAAFTETNLDQLFDQNERFLTSDFLKALVWDVRNICAKTSDWRVVRAFLDERYGYAKFGGGCHIVPNHALTLASILLGKDSFARSLMIAVSAGWDTDCNAGNVGCFNGIRLGLDALTSEVDFRTPVADRLFVVTADGGEAISDAVRETRKIVRAAALTTGETITLPKQRFAFEHRGSVQGFESCPILHSKATLNLANNEGTGLCITVFGEDDAFVSTPTFFDPNASWQGYDAIGSPSLYEGQTIHARFSHEEETATLVTPYVCFAKADGGISTAQGEARALLRGETQICWTVPRLGGQPIVRVGFALRTMSANACRLTLHSLDWVGAPERLSITGAHLRNITDPAPFLARMFVSSAKNFGLSLVHTLAVSHPEENGVVTFGTRDFDDYTVSATLTPHLHERCGLVIRARGHRQYYAALLSGQNTLSLVARDAGGDTVLAQTAFCYGQYAPLEMSLSAVGNRLTVRIGEMALSAEDAQTRYPSGGTGFRVDSGTMMVDDMIVYKL